MVLALVSGLCGISYALSAFLPSSFASLEAVRVVGGALLAGGLGLAGWTFRHRHPRDMMVSTCCTFVKAMGRLPLVEASRRREKLVVEGPHKYVRNPLYLGVVSIVLGWGLVASSTFFLVAAAVFLLWFWLVLIPFEERELEVLFGGRWTAYSKATPMLVPSMRRKRPASGGRGEAAKR